jgi:hypothetical protein
MQGMRLQYPEIANILVRGQSVDYGVHELDSGTKLDTSHLLFTRRTSASWVGYCTAGVVYASDIIGVLLLVSPVQEIMQNLYQLQDQMVMIFAAIAFFFTIKMVDLADRFPVNEFFPIEDTEYAVKYSSLEPNGIYRGTENASSLVYQDVIFDTKPICTISPETA